MNVLNLTAEIDEREDAAGDLQKDGVVRLDGHEVFRVHGIGWMRDDRDVHEAIGYAFAAVLAQVLNDRA